MRLQRDSSTGNSPMLLQVLTLDEIEVRASAIGLPTTVLCDDADLVPSTLSRWRAKQVVPRPRSLRRISRALIEREKALLVHLIGLHGVPGIEVAA